MRLFGLLGLVDDYFVVCRLVCCVFNSVVLDFFFRLFFIVFFVMVCRGGLNVASTVFGMIGGLLC